MRERTMKAAGTSGSAPSPGRSALRVATTYVLVGAAWIFLSDRALETVGAGGSGTAQTAKGWLFVLVTGGLLAWLVRVELARAVRAERERRVAGETLRAVLDASPAAIVVLDQDARVTLWSKGAERLFGWAAEEVLGGGLPFVPEDRTEESRALLTAIREGSPIREVALRRRRKDGAEIDVLLSAAPIREETGVVGMVGVLVDFGERRRAEEELARRARRLHDLHAIDGAILRAASLRDLAGEALARLRDLVPSERASLSLLDVGAGEARVLAVSEDRPLGPEEGQAFPAEGLVPAARLEAGDVVRLADLGTIAERWTYLHELAAAGVRSVLAAPLVADQEPVGLLTLSSRSPGAFGPAEEEVVAEVASQLAVACQQARLREELTRRLAELRATDADRRRLLRSLVDAEERERRRIAADIHDDPVQAMTALGMRLQILRRRADDEATASQVAELERAVGKTVERLRGLMFDLRPNALEQAGVGAALREHLHRIAPDFGWTLRDEVDGELPEVVATTCYRIGLEALTNARKHADARHVEIELRSRDRGVCLRVSDDGAGFDPSTVAEGTSGHLGLISMRERAELAGGWMRVDTEPGRGTTVECWVPAERERVHGAA